MSENDLIVCCLAAYLLAWGIELWRPTGDRTRGRTPLLLTIAVGLCFLTTHLISRIQSAGLPALYSSNHWVLPLAWVLTAARLVLTWNLRNFGLGEFLLPGSVLLLLSDFGMYAADAVLVHGIPLTYLAGLVCWIVLVGVLLVRLLQCRRSAKRQPGRLRLINAGLSVWFLLAGLTGVEAFFALVLDQSDSFNQSNVSKSWFHRHVRENYRGFRDERELDLDPLFAGKRLWFIGDSFTFGHGVRRPADRFSDRIAQNLQARRPGAVQVNNVAKAGINTTGVLGIMQAAYQNHLKPDVLVYVVCLNDIEPYVETWPLRYKAMTRSGPPFPLFSHTYFFNMLWFRLKQAIQPEVRNYYDDLAEAYDGPPGRRLLLEIDRLHRMCQAEGTELRIAVFPFLHNPNAEYPFARAHALLLEHCQKQGIRAMDLRPALSPHAKEGLVVNPFDAHPNERAHALAATALEQDLLRDLFVPTVESK